MEVSTTVELAAPYLVFLGDIENAMLAKTAFGVVDWHRELCAGQYRLPGSHLDLGLKNMTPSEAAKSGVRSFLIGVANVGGFFPESWRSALLEAARAGLDVVSGMHTRLEEVEGLVDVAAASGARLIDVRVPPTGLPVGTGRKRSGRRLLSVGTDCAVGKKYTVLALEREMRARGMKVTYRATGQTGIMIAGAGIPIDAVVADFVAGAAEILSPDNDPDHWDLIEGQGAIFHPGYSGVTLGLLHGSQPDAIVVCHEAARETLEGFEGFHVRPIAEYIDLYLRLGRLTNPDIRCFGVSINTSKVPPGKRVQYLTGLSRELALPCIDPLVDGIGPIVDELEKSAR